MKAAANAVESNQRETYTRTRDDPFFNGMRRGELAITKKGVAIDQGKLARINSYRSTSDIGDQGSRNASANVPEDASHNPRDLPFDIVLEPIGRSLSGRWSKTSSPLVVIPDSGEQGEGLASQGGFTRPAILPSYHLEKVQTDIPLPPSAALFYHGHSRQMAITQSCKSVQKLNTYLKARRADVNAGVPGKFLHVVTGSDIADAGSVASTIMHAFHLYQTPKNNQYCTVPVINMKRDDLDSHAGIQWLLDSCHIDLASLFFIDEIDLSYYDLFGCLKLVLVNCDKIPPELEALREAIVEVFHCTKSAVYSWVDDITVREDVSCCTVIAEKFAIRSPEILAGQGFSRLLLAGILVDTGNLTNSNCTSKDKYMATLLINAAGRFGFSGLYQILKYKSHGSSDFRVKDILRKEFKKWTISGKSNTIISRLQDPGIGMSSIGMSIVQLLSHDSSSVQEIIHFQSNYTVIWNWRLPPLPLSFFPSVHFCGSGIYI